jgi:hypothetical protein
LRNQLAITFEVGVVHRIEPYQRREQAYICFSENVAAKKSLLLENLLNAVKRIK